MQGFLDLSAWDPQNNGDRDGEPPSTLEVSFNSSCTHIRTLLGLCKREHQYNTKEQPNSYIII